MDDARPVPAPILEQLRATVTLRWSGRDAPPPLDAIPAALPLGEVAWLSSGGPFGWLAEGRLDEIDGRLALEVLEDSRMAGPDHYRLWEDGTREQLEGEHIGYAYPRDATEDEKAAILEEYGAHNRRVAGHLRERGFRKR